MLAGRPGQLPSSAFARLLRRSSLSWPAAVHCVPRSWRAPQFKVRAFDVREIEPIEDELLADADRVEPAERPTQSARLVILSLSSSTTYWPNWGPIRG